MCCQTLLYFLQVVHNPIVNVTPAMVNWWFNGNIDGDMKHPVNGQWYPRYLVWHPRDHISQNTLIAGERNPKAAGHFGSGHACFSSPEHGPCQRLQPGLCCSLSRSGVESLATPHDSWYTLIQPPTNVVGYKC